MTLKFSRTIVGLAICLASACSTPGASDLCHESCDAYKNCGYANDDQTASCHTDCTNNKGSLSDRNDQLARDCKNANDVLQKASECYMSTPCQPTVTDYGSLLLGCMNTALNQCMKP